MLYRLPKGSLVGVWFAKLAESQQDKRLHGACQVETTKDAFYDSTDLTTLTGFVENTLNFDVAYNIPVSNTQMYLVREYVVTVNRIDMLWSSLVPMA